MACKDMNSSTAQNIELIRKESGLANVLDCCPKYVANTLKYCPVPVEEEWRLGLLNELLLLRKGQLECELSLEEISDLIEIVTTTYLWWGSQVYH